MGTIALQDLAQNTSTLLERVEAGERFVVSRDGRPIAELRSIARSPDKPRPLGLAAREVVVPSDFDDPLPEDVLRDFERSDLLAREAGNERNVVQE